MWVTIEVSAEDIESGKRQSQCECPVVLAGNRVLLNMRVGKDAFSVGDPLEGDMAGRTYYDLPVRAREFIYWFDLVLYSSPLAPFSFKVNVGKEFVL